MSKWLQSHLHPGNGDVAIPKKRLVCHIGVKGVDRHVEFLCETEVLAKRVHMMRKYLDEYLLIYCSIFMLQ